MHSSGFVKNSETRLLHLHLEVIIFFFRLRCSPRFQLELSLHWIACGNLLPLLLQRLWNRCSFKPFSHCCHWFDILVERNKRIREWIDRLCVVDSVSFRRSVNDVRTGRRWLFHHGRVYAEKTWRTAQSSIFRRQYLVQDFTNRGEKSGFGYPRSYAFAKYRVFYCRETRFFIAVSL